MSNLIHLTECDEFIASERWRDHFNNNIFSQMDIPWDRGQELSYLEWHAIASSVQEFQLGESSEGYHFNRCAREYARRTGDKAYADAVQLFIREEQRHSRYLGRFMDLNNIPRLKFSFGDIVFRSLRKLAGLETSVAVLITAEIIAKVYYRCLKKVTHSAILQHICRQIMKDEALHVIFQGQRLALLRRNRGRFALAITNLAQRSLFAGACLMVWKNHRSVMQATGMSFPAFWSECWSEFRQVFPQMQPFTFPGLTGNLSMDS